MKRGPPKLQIQSYTVTEYLIIIKSISEYFNHVLKKKRGLEGGSFSSPKRYMESRECLNVDSFDTEAICHTVYAF